MNKLTIILSLLLALSISAVTQTTIIKADTGYGLINPKGNIVIEPTLDSIYSERKECIYGGYGPKHFFY